MSTGVDANSAGHVTVAMTLGGADGSTSADCSATRVAEPKPDTVQALCNLLRRLELVEHDHAGSMTLLPWLRAELAIAIASGPEGTGQQAQLQVMISMLEETLDDGGGQAAHADSPSSGAEATTPQAGDGVARARTTGRHPLEAPKAADDGLLQVLIDSPALRSGARERRLVDAVTHETIQERSALLRRARRREACARAVIELTAARAHAQAHRRALEVQLQELRLWQFVTGRAAQATLDEFRQVQHGCANAAEIMGCAAKALASLSAQLADHPAWQSTTPDARADALDGLQRLVGRLAYPGASAACARPSLDEELHLACARLGDGPLPPPALSVPPSHARVRPLLGLASRTLDRMGRERSVEAKAELVSEWWRLVLAGTRIPKPPWAASGQAAHLDGGVPNGEADDGETSLLDEEGLADLLPTAAWLIVEARPALLLSDLQSILELLPPEQLVSPTAPMLLTAACMVRNLQLQAEHARGDPLGARAAFTPPARAAVATTPAGASVDRPLGSAGVGAVRRLRDACARHAALSSRFGVQLSELRSRLCAAASARYATQQHSLSLTAALCRLYARGPPSAGGHPHASLPLVVVTPPAPPNTTLAGSMHCAFITELRNKATHLLSATASARLFLSHAADHEPKHLIHAILHGLYGDLSQPADASGCGALLGRFIELHLVQLPNPLPTGGAAPPPLPPHHVATAFLQSGSMVAELVRGFLRLLPAARRFLQLCLSAPLNTILYEATLDLSLPSSALAESGALPPEALRRALAATCDLVLTSLAHHAAVVPRAVQLLAAATWRAALERGLEHASALAIVAQLLIGCWLAPALAAPQAFGIFPEPSPHDRTCANLDAIARELCRLPAALHHGDGGPGVRVLVDWLQAVLFLSERAEHTDAASAQSPGSVELGAIDLNLGSISPTAGDSCEEDMRRARTLDEAAVEDAEDGDETDDGEARSGGHPARTPPALCVLSRDSFAWLHAFVERDQPQRGMTSFVLPGNHDSANSSAPPFAMVLQALKSEVDTWRSQNAFELPSSVASSAAASPADSELLLVDLSGHDGIADATSDASSAGAVVGSAAALIGHWCAELVQGSPVGGSNAPPSPLQDEWMPDAAETPAGWLRRLAVAAESAHETVRASRLLLLAASTTDLEQRAVLGANDFVPLLGTRASALSEELRMGRRQIASASRSLAQYQRRLDEARRVCELQVPLPPCPFGLASFSDPVSIPSLTFSDLVTIPCAQTDAAGGLLLLHALPALSPKLTPRLHAFQAAHPPLPTGACTCFAPHHLTCPPCAERRDALENLIMSLSADLLSAASPAPPASGAPQLAASAAAAAASVGAAAAASGKNAAAAVTKGKHRRTFSGGTGALAAAFSGKDVGGGGGASSTGASAASDAARSAEDGAKTALLRSHLRELLTRQLYHSLLARSADDEAVAAHLSTLDVLEPAHLGVTKALRMPHLWSGAIAQLRALDAVPTPAAGLRCILRSWDALLGVLGVWSRHAQADDFMPLMAYVVIHARPARLLSQLHFIRNHLGELQGRQEMWMAHFTAACEVACRLSPAISSKGLAVSLDESVWRPRPPPLLPPEASSRPEATLPKTPERQPGHKRSGSSGSQMLLAARAKLMASVDRQMQARASRKLVDSGGPLDAASTPVAEPASEPATDDLAPLHTPVPAAAAAPTAAPAPAESEDEHEEAKRLFDSTDVSLALHGEVAAADPAVIVGGDAPSAYPGAQLLAADSATAPAERDRRRRERERQEQEELELALAMSISSAEEEERQRSSFNEAADADDAPMYQVLAGAPAAAGGAPDAEQHEPAVPQ